MSNKITRVLQKQFGSQGPSGDFGVFGSKANPPQTFSMDPALIQSLNAFLYGWGQSIIGNYEPPLEDMNSLFLLAFRQLAYVFQEGIADIGSITKANGIVYTSVVDNNTGNNPITDTGTNWVQGFGGLNGGVPTGSILTFAGMSNAVPAGYLLGDGSAISRTTYSRLYQVIGTVYGAGDGTTTFNLPNGKGRILVGADGTTEFLTPGQVGGEKYHLLTGPESGVQDHVHGGTFNSHAPFNVGSNGNGQFGSTDGSGNINALVPHNNLQPYLVVGGIIVKI